MDKNVVRNATNIGTVALDGCDKNVRDKFILKVT